MKLECDVVRDLWPLYQDGELSDSVDKAVRDHLNQCPGCRELYSGEVNVADVLATGTRSSVPSPDTDKKILTTIRRFRIKIIAIFIALLLTFLSFTACTNYKNVRMNLQDNLAMMYDSLKSITHSMELIPTGQNHVATLQNNWNIHLRSQILFYRNMNWLEKQALPEDIYPFLTRDILRFYDYQNIRRSQGILDQVDEISLNRSVHYLGENTRLIDEYGLGDVHSKGPVPIPRYLLKWIDPGDLTDNYNSVNELIMLYNRYLTLPEELIPLTDSEIKERVRYVWGENNVEVELLPRQQNYDAFYTFTQSFRIIAGNQVISLGAIDKYTGQLLSLGTNERPHKIGNHLPPEQMESWLRELFQREYAEEYDLQIEFEGKSGRSPWWYYFTIQPHLEGYPISTHWRASFDNRTGKLLSLTQRADYALLPPQVDTTINYDHQQALEQLAIADNDKYYFVETLIIPSLLSNQYELVHYYLHGDKELFINTGTGQQDYPLN